MSIVLLAALALAPLAASGSARDACPWETRSPASAARFESSAVVVDGRLYVLGGFANGGVALTTCEAYDPHTDTWTRLADLPVPLTHAQAVVDGTRILLVGGFVGTNPAPATADVLAYDTATDAWSSDLPDLPAPRAAGAIALVGRKLHYVGGVLPDRITTVGDHWVLDLDDPGAGWDTTSHPPLPLGRCHASAVALDGRVLVIGGQIGHDPYPVPWGISYPFDVDAVDAYDPASGTWSALADAPSPRSHNEPSTFVHQGRVWSLGGQDSIANVKALDEVVTYDPVSNAWTSLDPLPHGLFAPAAGIVDGWLVVATGTDDASGPPAASAHARRWGTEVGCLDAAPATLSLALGGSQTLQLDAGATHGGLFYILLGSAAGTFPGVRLGESAYLPLNPDSYLLSRLIAPSAPPIASGLGALDAHGRATVALTVPTATNPALAGLALHHAYVVLDPAAEHKKTPAASNAIRVELVP